MYSFTDLVKNFANENEAKKILDNISNDIEGAYLQLNLQNINIEDFISTEPTSFLDLLVQIYENKYNKKIYNRPSFTCTKCKNTDVECFKCKNFDNLQERFRSRISDLEKKVSRPCDNCNILKQSISNGSCKKCEDYETQLYIKTTELEKMKQEYNSCTNCSQLERDLEEQKRHLMELYKNKQCKECPKLKQQAIQNTKIISKECSDKTYLTSDLLEKNMKIDTLEERNSQLHKQLNACNQQIEKMRNDFAAQLSQFKSTNVKSETILPNDDIVILKNWIAGKDREIYELNQKILTYESNAAYLKANLDACQQNSNRMADELWKCNETVKQYVQYSEEMKNIFNAQIQKAELKDSISAAAVEEIKKTYLEEWNRLTSQIKQNDGIKINQLITLQDKVTELNLKLQFCEKENLELRQSKSNVEMTDSGEMDNYKKMLLDKTESDINKLKQAYFKESEVLKSEITTLEQESERTRLQLEDVSKQFQKESEECNQLKSSYFELQTNFNNCTTQLSRLSEEIGNRNSEIATLKGNVTRLEETLRECVGKDVAGKKDEYIASLTQQKEVLNRQIETLNVKVQTLTEASRECEDKILILQQQVTDKEKVIMNLQSEANRLEEELEEARDLQMISNDDVNRAINVNLEGALNMALDKFSLMYAKEISTYQKEAKMAYNNMIENSDRRFNELKAKYDRRIEENRLELEELQREAEIGANTRVSLLKQEYSAKMLELQQQATIDNENQLREELTNYQNEVVRVVNDMDNRHKEEISRLQKLLKTRDIKTKEESELFQKEAEVAYNELSKQHVEELRKYQMEVASVYDKKMADFVKMQETLNAYKKTLNSFLDVIPLPDDVPNNQVYAKDLALAVDRFFREKGVSVTTPDDVAGMELITELIDYIFVDLNLKLNNVK